MSLGTFSAWAVDKSVALVNLLIDHGETATRGQVHTLVAGYGVDEADVDVAGFLDLARRLHHSFQATDQTTRITRLNALLERFQPSPRIVEHDAQDPHFHYVTADGPAVDHVGASMVMALADAVVDQGADRFGWCEAPACERLFFDRSRSRTQRFCSRGCATRVHVAAHRARA